MMKIKYAFLMCLCSSYLMAQKAFQYRTEIKGIVTTWHSISLPDNFYQKACNISDLRIMGITEKGDTIEAPYFLKDNTEGIKTETENFKILNQTHNEKGFYYTFEIPTVKSLNEIALDFEEKNFDWQVDLKGSFDQKEWFSILENSRITAFKNGESSYRFTKLQFPLAQYKYWQICIKAEKQPNLLNAHLFDINNSQIEYRTYAVKKMEKQDDKAHKTSVIDIELNSIFPVSALNIEVDKKFDFVRNISISCEDYQRKSAHFWIPIFNGKISSTDTSAFKFDKIWGKHFKITIENDDNTPLNITNVSLKGVSDVLIARFTQKAQYYIMYGSGTSQSHNYDIENFKNTVPSDIASLTLGNEEVITPIASTPSIPLSKNWLWAIMGIIIVGMGWQTLKMMKARQ